MKRFPPVLVSAAFLVTAVACGPEAEFDREGIPQSDATPIAVTDVLEQPETYAGKRVSLGGKVVDVWSQRVFSMMGQQYQESDSLLVISKRTTDTPEIERAGVTDLGVRVRVSGTLHITNGNALSRELGVDLSQVPAHLHSPILVADEVSIAPAAR